MEEHVNFVMSQVQHLMSCTNSGHKLDTVTSASTDASAFTSIPSIPVHDFVHMTGADAGVSVSCVCVYGRVCVYIQTDAARAGVCVCVRVCVCVCMYKMLLQGQA